MQQLEEARDREEAVKHRESQESSGFLGGFLEAPLSSLGGARLPRALPGAPSGAPLRVPGGPWGGVSNAGLFDTPPPGVHSGHFASRSSIFEGNPRCILTPERFLSLCITYNGPLSGIVRMRAGFAEHVSVAAHVIYFI